MMVMNRDVLIEQLCAEHCAFYRPDKEEDLACHGFVVLLKLLELRKEVPASVAKSRLIQGTEDDLFRSLCLTCSFFKGDCDYASWKRGDSSDQMREEVHPCGGFLFLGYCIDHGSLDIRTINGVI